MQANLEVQGTLIRAKDPEYESARRLWNDAVDKRPAVIVRCRDASDAVAALAHATREHLPVSVRGGGHNLAGTALCEGGVVIDFSDMRAVEVDPKRMVARVEPGALWATSTRPLKPTVWPLPQASSPIPAWPV